MYMWDLELRFGLILLELCNCNLVDRKIHLSFLGETISSYDIYMARKLIHISLLGYTLFRSLM
jgi:hypothetical protein